MSRSSNIRVINNTITQSTVEGINNVLASYCTIEGNHISHSGSGVWIEDSNKMTVSNNIVIDNYSGVVLSANSSSNTITRNLFAGHPGKGVVIWSGENNHISLNFFRNNNEGFYQIQGFSQGYDDGLNNEWYNSTSNEGNWWSDYLGTGSYSLEGSGGFVDLYPQSTLRIDSPTTTTYNVSSVMLNYTVHTFSNQAIITIYIDDLANSTNLPSGAQVTSLTTGMHNLSILVEELGTKEMTNVVFWVDLPSGTTTSSVSSTTTSSASSTTPTTSSDFLTLEMIVSALGFVGLMFWLRQKRRIEKE
ncbi:MAG: right-handed parallel beta-helix repeat-containing protein [Candidatus Hodarchaeota archaeon]